MRLRNIYRAKSTVISVFTSAAIVCNVNVAFSQPKTENQLQSKLLSRAQDFTSLHPHPNAVQFQEPDLGLWPDAASWLDRTQWSSDQIGQSINTDELVQIDSNGINLNFSKKPKVIISKPLPPKISARKANAVFVMLVRNEDLYGAISTIREIEDRFNRNHHYPYIFLNDKPFTTHFKEVMKSMSQAVMAFELIPNEHWSYPDWISERKAAETRQRMKHIIYGASESYRHMCRYQSGFIHMHESMLQYDYYWRIEPDVKYTCDIDFDPFLYMQDNNKKYGFTISLYEYAETIHGLWNTTKEFMAKYPDLLAKDNALNLISNDGGQTYNNCHFWSNFEIVDARWMRGKAFQEFFRHLDHAGGFFYERWGDAPVHTIAAALLLPLENLHFFKEIGYFHAPFHNCPAEPELQAKCHCDPALNVNRERFACTAKFLELAGEKRMMYPEEVDD